MTRLYRYSERDGTWNLTLMGGSIGGMREPAPPGPVGEYPEWLAPIVHIAVCGGHAVNPPLPPPQRFFWFRVDADNELIEFVPVESMLT